MSWNCFTQNLPLLQDAKSEISFFWIDMYEIGVLLLKKDFYVF